MNTDTENPPLYFKSAKPCKVGDLISTGNYGDCRVLEITPHAEVRVQNIHTGETRHVLACSCDLLERAKPDPTPAATRRRAQVIRLKSLAGGRAMRPHTEKYSGGDDPRENTLCALIDTLTNLMHHAHAAGVGFEAAMACAKEHFQAELEGEF